MPFSIWLLAALLALRLVRSSYRRGKAAAERAAADVGAGWSLLDSGFGLHRTPKGNWMPGWVFMFGPARDKPPELGVYASLFGTVLFTDTTPDPIPR